MRFFLGALIIGTPRYATNSLNHQHKLLRNHLNTHDNWTNIPNSSTYSIFELIMPTCQQYKPKTNLLIIQPTIPNFPSNELTTPAFLSTNYWTNQTNLPAILQVQLQAVPRFPSNERSSPSPFHIYVSILLLSALHSPSQNSWLTWLWKKNHK